VPTQFCAVLYREDTDLLLRAFTVYVLPLLEYNSIVWSPQVKQDVEYIEFNVGTQGAYLG